MKKSKYNSDEERRQARLIYDRDRHRNKMAAMSEDERMQFLQHKRDIRNNKTDAEKKIQSEHNKMLRAVNRQLRIDNGLVPLQHVYRSTIESRIKKTLSSAKSRAKKKKITFNLTYDDIKDIPEFCPIRKVKMQFKEYGVGHGYDDNTPSLDRLNPDAGYTKDNVNWISMKANTMKNNGTLEDVKNLAEWWGKMLDIKNES